MHRAARLSAIPVILLLAAVSGCTRQSPLAAPQTQEPRGLEASQASAASGNAKSAFYPMAAGNQWRYRGHSFTEVITPGGARDTVVDSNFDLVIDQLGGQADQSEFHERWTETFASGSASIIKTFRQTRDGLWQVVATEPLLEIQLLAYPVHVEQTWLQGVLFVSNPRLTVEAHETLHTPVGNIPAWRIRIERPTQGPNDFHHVWYGQAGYLQLVSHSESVLADGSIVRSDHSHHLESIRIAGPGRFSAAHAPRGAATRP